MSAQPTQASSATLVLLGGDGNLSSREALILAQAVWEVGADAWAAVARVLSKHPLISRPPAFFTPQACQSMYQSLMKQANLDCVERNKAIHAPLNLKLAQKHFQVRVQELSDEIAMEESKFKEILSEIEEIQSGQWDHKMQSTFNEQPRSPSVPRSTRSQVEESDEEPQEQDRPVTPLRHSATPTTRLSAEADVRIQGEIPKTTPNGQTSEGSDLSVATDVGSTAARGEKNDELVNDLTNQDSTILHEGHSQPTNSETRSAPSSPAPMDVDQEEDIHDLEQPDQESVPPLTLLPDTMPATAQIDIIPLETDLERLLSPADEQTPHPEPQETSSAIEVEQPTSVNEEGTVATRKDNEVTPLKKDHGQDKESAEDEGETSGEEPPPITRRTTRASAAASASKRKPRRTKESTTTLEISLPEAAVVEESDSQTPSLKVEEADQIPSPAPHEHLRKREGKRKASFVDGVDSPRDRKRTRDDSEPVDEEEPATTAPRSRRRGDRTEEQMALRRFQNVITMLHSQISQHRNGNIFHNPIKNSEAPDYHEIVKRPMDLKTIKTRVKDGAIANSLEYQRDIFLMFANAMMYNRPGSGVYVMAEDMMVESEGYINSFRQTEGLVQRAQRM